jgi:hypothetical protein
VLTVFVEIVTLGQERQVKNVLDVTVAWLLILGIGPGFLYVFLLTQYKCGQGGATVSSFLFCHSSGDF